MKKKKKTTDIFSGIGRNCNRMAERPWIQKKFRSKKKTLEKRGMFTQRNATNKRPSLPVDDHPLASFTFVRPSPRTNSGKRQLEMRPGSNKTKKNVGLFNLPATGWHFFVCVHLRRTLGKKQRGGSQLLFVLDFRWLRPVMNYLNFGCK